jgi:hypothetical protein
MRLNIANRLQAYKVRHPVSINRKIDLYLSENLANMMAEYKIADRSDMGDLDSSFKDLETRMEDLEKWKGDFELRLKEGTGRMDRLKLKAGMK